MPNMVSCVMRVGTHDFSSFRGVRCGATGATRTLDHVGVRVWDNNHMRTGGPRYTNVDITFRGRSFLFNQVCMMMAAVRCE